MERLTDHVVRLGTWIVNWYLLADDEGVTVIDGAVPAYSRQLEPGLAELGRSLDDVKAIVLTHAHADHVGVVRKLQARLGIPVYVHRADRDLATTAKSFGRNDGSMLPYLRRPMTYRLLFELGRNGGMIPQKIENVTVFDDGDELPVPGRPHAIHSPGHTDGHTSFVAGDVLFAGDALCTLNPLTGERGPQLMPSAFNRSTEQALASLDNLVGTHASLLVPGHGDPVREPNGAIGQARTRGAT
jgi:glyoxylase-like metal-dependent hydrolase (beta-lactamase superfamily II)